MFTWKMLENHEYKSLPRILNQIVNNTVIFTPCLVRVAFPEKETKSLRFSPGMLILGRDLASELQHLLIEV